MKNDKIIQFLILRNRHSTIEAILTARFGEVEVAVGRKFNCALTVVLCREGRLLGGAAAAASEFEVNSFEHRA